MQCDIMVDKRVFIVLYVLMALGRCSLVWTPLDDIQAVCNDYSRAGYFFHRSSTNSTKWLIYLESGGLCYSPDTCNSRYLKPEVRREFATNKNDPSYQYNPQVDLAYAWESTSNRSISSRVNPYMTSMATFIDSSFTVEGRDFMNVLEHMNPVFYDFNHVLVPYCSSDMWLAEDNYCPVNLSSRDPQKQFLDAYKPESPDLQFTFRGRTIIKSVIRQLIADNGMSNASEVLLAGSSAGGLGVVNNAKWIVDMLNASSIDASISILTDSAWFINFRDNIFRRFDGTTRPSDMKNAVTDRMDERLLNLIQSIPQCVSVTSTGSPCCISLECVMTDERYFPVGDVPVMVVASLYDVFLLADAIAQLTPPGTTDISQDLPSVGLQFIVTVAEYGGVMNSTIKTSASTVDWLSYIATQCFQHVYFSPSTLTAPGGILEDSSLVEISATLGSFSGSFRHLIQSGIWSDYTFGNHTGNTTYSGLQSCDKSKVYSMKDAVNMWYICRFNETFEFRDTCYSVHCHDFCPEEIDFLQNTSDEYPTWAIIVIVLIVVTITVLSLVLKCAFYIWKKVLFMKQDEYLDKLEKDEENLLDGIPQFPVCGIEDAVSIACLDLRYSVVARKKKIKDERQDETTVSFAIAHHIEDEDEDTQFIRGNERRSARSIRTVKSGSARVSTSHAAEVLEEVDHSQPQVHFKEPEPEDSRDDMFTESTSPFIPNKKSVKVASHTLKRQDALEKKNSSTSVTYSSLGDQADVPLMDDGFTHSNKGLSYYLSCGKEMKRILKGVSIYFNPGELVGIMGPSGCGKTTFLDLLTGRSRAGHITGEIFVNGIPLDRVRDEYLSFTGYVLQLATPFYEELTVRENIVLAAHMKLPRKVTWREKFTRVEQVMDITGLTNVGDMTVGGATGPGISGGQKKRLTIALQLLTMPRVIFLDEPTSGLDSTASVELLSHLNNLADSNRTVVVTIHQPRLEIFHMFHKLILLCDGKIAYHGVPQKAYGFFAEAAVNSFWNRNLIPEIGDHNPADIIMDMLGKPVLRRAILSHYQESTEPELVKWAVRKARVKDFESMSIETLETITPNDLKRDSMTTTTSYQIQQGDFVKQDKAAFFNRLAVLETRADMRATLIWRIYLPVIFFGYGFLLGTTYFQQDQPLLIMAGFCVYSVASALFMFPVMQNYFIKALEVYKFESADGAGRASDIVIQAVARFSTMAIVPVVLCSAVLYLLLVNVKFWDITVLLKLIVVGMALNQTWIALLTFLLCALPSLAFRLSPIISSIAGFSSGFFIPREVVGWWYRWIFYINPNYYGFSASAYFLLSNANNECDKSDLIECTLESGNYALKRFFFDQTQPYMNIAILLLMTFVYLALAVFSNWLRHTNFFLNLWTKLRHKKTFLDEDDMSLEGADLEEDTSQTASQGTHVPLIDPVDSSASMSVGGDEETTSSYREVGPTSPPYGDDDVFDEVPTPATPNPDPSTNDTENNAAKERWIRFAKGTLDRKIDDEERIELETKLPGVNSNGRPNRLAIKNRKRRKRAQSIFLGDNQEHMVFKPSSSKTPPTPDSQFANLVVNLMAQKHSDCAQTPSPAVGNSLKERKQHFEWSIKTTQEVVKEKTEELKRADDTQKEKVTLRDLTKKVTQKLKDEKEPKMANVVGEIMKLTASAPTSFDSDENENREGSRPRTQSTATGAKVKRRQRRVSSSSNVLLQKFMDRAKKTKPNQSSNQPTKQSFPSSPLKKAVSASFDIPDKPKPKVNLVKRSTDISLPSERKLSDHNNTPPPVEQKPPAPLTSPVYVLQLDEQLADIQEISDNECDDEEIEAL